MLDPRIARLAIVPFLLAVLVVAFSLEDRPRPIGTTIAPDAFDGDRAALVLERLAAAYPLRAPGSEDDEALAQEIVEELEGIGSDSPQVETATVRTIDGDAEVTTVVAERVGDPAPGIVVLAHRDAAEPGSKAELSGTAVLLELARIAIDGRFRRTVTFISTSGGSGGAAGAREAIELIDRPIQGAIVIGDVAGTQTERPFVTGFSNGHEVAPLQLLRTVEQAVRDEVGTNPGGARAPAQWARLAIPFATGEHATLLAAGIPAVLVSVSGEKRPDPATPVEAERLEGFGRAVLRAITALDNGPTISEDPSAVVVTNRKVLPEWAVRLLGAALLLPVALLVVDGLARARRRREAVGRWLVYVLATAAPFALVAALAVLSRITELLPAAPPAPSPPGAIPVDGSAPVALVLLVFGFALGWFGLRRAILLLAGVKGRPAADGAGIALLVVSVASVGAVWVANPHLAILLIPALLLAVGTVAGASLLPRWIGAVAVVLGLVLPVLAAQSVASALGYGLADAAWAAVLAVAGGHVGPLAWLVLSLLAGCAVATVLVAFARRRDHVDNEPGVTVRGPVTYAGPGALGGVDSALRR